MEISLKLLFVVLGLAALVGAAIGYVFRWLIALGRQGSLDLEIRQRLLEAKEEASRIISKAEEDAREEADDKLGDIRAREERLEDAETRMSELAETLQKKEADLDKERREVKVDRERLVETLSLAASMSREEAREQIVRELEKEYDEVLALRLKKLEEEAENSIRERAYQILGSAVQRLSGRAAEEFSTFTITLPSDDVKGKIIGKEGRNIRAFERAAGVDLIVDASPNAVTISSFDPLRRHIAKVALERLIEDGRIQPARIEEFVLGAEKEVENLIEERGRDATLKAGVHGIPPKLVALLGRLAFRTSYGQNVLNHSIEMALIADFLAEKLHADRYVARTASLLHDIGKSIDHEVSGTHAEIGKHLLQKFDIDPRVVDAVAAHHDEYPTESLESLIVQVADTLSARRPGARRETIDAYVKRLEDLEEIANAFDGVERSYAIEGGRELRVFVRADRIPDSRLHQLARDIAKKIQEEVRFPGEIKVNLIREQRVIEFAR
jgi:ribonuclease Y